MVKKLTLILLGEERLRIEQLAEKLETEPTTILKEALTLYEGIVKQAELGLTKVYVGEGDFEEANFDIARELKHAEFHRFITDGENTTPVEFRCKKGAPFCTEMW